MRLRSLRRTLPALAVAALVAGCGKDRKADDSSDTATQADTAAAAPAPAAQTSAASTSSGAPAPLAVEDIDRWQRGMEAELQAVQDAGQRLKRARTGADSLEAVGGALDMATRAAGARAAGVDEARYGFIQSTLSSIVGQMAPLEQEMDVSQMPPAMVAEMKKNREQALARVSEGQPAALLDALRPRAAALRKLDMTLAGQRIKAAGG